jgi:hypothetical protein
VLINLDLDLLPADLKLIMDPHVVPWCPSNIVRFMWWLNNYGLLIDS